MGNYVAMAVTGIATLAYLCMTYNVGVAQVDGHPVYYARYLDWFFTTPFFLLDLSLLAGADTWSTFYVMLLNALCIAAGAIGALNPKVGWPCFIFGMVTFVMFLSQRVVESIVRTSWLQLLPWDCGGLIQFCSI